MAGSINKVILVGNVGNEPEVRQTQDGREIANLSIATSDSWRDKNTGERREKTEWHRVVVFNEGLVKVIKNYVHKGSKLYLEGALQTRKWTDQSGQDKYSTEVVLQGYNGNLTMLDNKGSGGGNYQQGEAGGGYQQNQQSPAFGQVPGGNAAAGGAPAPADLDDEIPF
jgi:single-strand DNA-binding protein